MATRRASPAGVFPAADAMTADDANACQRASVRLGAMVPAGIEWRMATSRDRMQKGEYTET
jgi:hypothetical protein